MPYSLLMDVRRVMTILVVAVWAGPVIDIWVDVQTAPAAVPPACHRWRSRKLDWDEAGSVLLLAVTSSDAGRIQPEMVSMITFVAGELFWDWRRPFYRTATVTLFVLTVWTRTIPVWTDFPTTVLSISSAAGEPALH
jgi:hypothetical protein